MSEFLRNILQPAWEVISLISMPWRAILVLLVFMPLLSWFFWRVFPWLLVILSQVVLQSAKVLVIILLSIEYWLTQYIKKRKHQPPEIIYIFDDVLAKTIDFLDEVSQKLNKLLGYTSKKRWRLNKKWFAIAAVVLSFLWFIRPILGEKTSAKLIDDAAIWWYSLDSWIMSPKWTSSAANHASPIKFVEAYYASINYRDYPTACNTVRIRDLFTNEIPVET